MTETVSHDGSFNILNNCNILSFNIYSKGHIQEVLHKPGIMVYERLKHFDKISTACYQSVVTFQNEVRVSHSDGSDKLVKSLLNASLCAIALDIINVGEVRGHSEQEQTI